ncbi:MAG: YlmC/YmxH family sporulation protein [Bacilli bacterium]|nr:YlmC/YmxH family sporulation protein [Acholeplasmataceae bacterium]
MLLSELESKDIINDHDGAKIGRIVDAEIDVATGRILNIRLQLGFRLLNIFSSKDTAIIPWNKIIKIGNDVIIVDYRNNNGD